MTGCGMIEWIRNMSEETFLGFLVIFLGIVAFGIAIWELTR